MTKITIPVIQIESRKDSTKIYSEAMCEGKVIATNLFICNEPEKFGKAIERMEGAIKLAFKGC